MKNVFDYSRGFAALSGVACILLLTGPAKASTIDYVSAYSTVFVDSVNYDSVLGLTETLPTSSAGQPITISSVVSNPSTNVLGLTAASNSIAGKLFDPNNGLTSVASASAYANLATGTVGAGGSDTNGNSAQAGGQIQDSVTFDNTSGHTVDIDVYWTFDGTFPVGGAGSLDSFFCLASASCTGSGGQFFRLQDGVFFGSPTVADPTTSQWVSATFTPGINVDSGTFHGVFAVPAGMSTDSLDAYLHILAASDTVDFTHTGALSFGNLNGVTFTSASGVLLTQAPEPGSWILIAAGLGLLGLATCAKAYTSHAV